MSKAISTPGEGRKRTAVVWALAVIVTLSSVIYQRMTGPTWPVSGNAVLGNESIKYKFLSSHVTTADAAVKIVAPPSLAGELRWKRVNTDDPWRARPMIRSGEVLLAQVPAQPAAGKVAYTIVLSDTLGGTVELPNRPVVIRFKDPVPAAILIPHIVAMFIALLLGTRTGIGAAWGETRLYRNALWTSILLFVGGLILGPIVQKYAFGEFWTGWPFGHDMTDNKTALAMACWLIALWRGNRSGRGRAWFIVAAAVSLLVYLIPHSVFGSELDYSSAPGQ